MLSKGSLQSDHLTLPLPDGGIIETGQGKPPYKSPELALRASFGRECRVSFLYLALAPVPSSEHRVPSVFDRVGRTPWEQFLQIIPA
jgi:hypothetical protein